MKAGDRSASDRDEAKRKHLAGEDRPGAIHKARQRRQFQLRMREENADCQEEDHPEFYEGAQIVSRREQQPNRQRTCKKSVNDNRDCERDTTQREPGRDSGRRRNRASAHNA